MPIAAAATNQLAGMGMASDSDSDNDSDSSGDIFATDRSNGKKGGASALDLLTELHGGELPEAEIEPEPEPEPEKKVKKKRGPKRDPIAMMKAMKAKEKAAEEAEAAEAASATHTVPCSFRL